MRGEVSDLGGAQARSADVRVSCLDDLEFLRGQVNLILPSGLDDRSDTELYFLIKALPDADPRIKIELVGQPSVKLAEKVSKATTTAARSHGKTVGGRKESLTPRLITPLLANGAVTLTWPRVDTPKHTGVRVFRKESQPAGTGDALGKEVYDGTPAQGEVECRSTGKHFPFPTASSTNTQVLDPPLAPPARKDRRREERVQDKPARLPPLAIKRSRPPQRGQPLAWSLKQYT